MNKPIPVHLLPTLLTLANLLCGFLSIALLARWDNELCLPVAAGLIPLALLLDGLDGAVARRLGVASRFGEVLDSLADVVSFGAAPALLIVVFCESNTVLPSSVVWAAAAWHLAATALRLTRSATEPPQETGAEGFTGLPCPAAGSLIAGIVIAATSSPNQPAGETLHAWAPLGMPGAAVLLGLLMVSRTPYPHPVRSLHTTPPDFGRVALWALAGAALLAFGGYALAVLCGLFVGWPVWRSAGRFLQTCRAAAPLTSPRVYRPGSRDR